VGVIAAGVHDPQLDVLLRAEVIARGADPDTISPAVPALIGRLFGSVDGLLRLLHPNREEMVWLVSGLGALCGLLDNADATHRPELRPVATGLTHPRCPARPILSVPGLASEPWQMDRRSFNG
jgi:hypothetical protein